MFLIFPFSVIISDRYQSSSMLQFIFQTFRKCSKNPLRCTDKNGSLSNKTDTSPFSFWWKGYFILYKVRFICPVIIFFFISDIFFFHIFLFRLLLRKCFFQCLECCIIIITCIQISPYQLFFFIFRQINFFISVHRDHIFYFQFSICNGSGLIQTQHIYMRQCFQWIDILNQDFHLRQTDHTGCQWYRDQ